MKRTFGGLALSLLMLLSLSGCSAIGDKMASMSIIYSATAVVSLLLLIGYCCLVRKKDIWFLFLFSCVFIVNAGYLTLSLSKTIEEALLANRIAYFGSVFLPMSMLMIITGVCKLNYKKWFPGLLMGLGTIVFLIAASPGYLDIYYRQVSLQVINGVTVLDKVYGPWHSVYLFYLLFYFGTMIGMIIYASKKKKVSSNMHAVILLVAVFVNIGVWLLEQLVKIDFEFLSISYIISELFLISLYLMLQEWEHLSVPEAAPESEDPACTAEEAAEVSQKNDPLVSPSQAFSLQHDHFVAQIETLTPTERVIFHFYLSGKTTKEIMQALNITENTLKYHNKNIYGKLGVSSRRQLLEIATALKVKE